MGRSCSTNEREKGNAHRLLMGKSGGKRPLGRPRGRWNKIIVHLREKGWAAMDLNRMARDMDQWRALVNTVMNFRVS
jgi:hypothetical protein